MITTITVVSEHKEYPVAETAEALRGLAEKLEQLNEDEGQRPQDGWRVRTDTGALQATFFVGAVTRE